MDTLKINHASGAITLGNLSAVEIVEISSAATAGAEVDTTAVAGVTDLNVVKFAGKLDLKAGATTNVSVAAKAADAAVVVAGGKNVDIALTDIAGTGGEGSISVGADAAADPAGTVTINATAKAAVNDTNVQMSSITVGGGTTVSVTQKVGSASGLIAGGAATTHTQGDVSVKAGATTTTVTIKQDAAVDAASQAAVAGATEVASVKFVDVASGDEVTVGGLKFTAAKDLTAAQVAQAFANLASGAVKPTNLVTPTAATATGDTQGSSANANGTFTGSLLAGWSSAAASGDTVVFTATANKAVDDLTATGATATTTTQGKDAVSAENTLGVVAGGVSITGAAALATVTVDGYGLVGGSTASYVSGDGNTSLETISLANGGSFDIASAAATLGLTLSNVNGTVDVAAGTKTLNVSVSHAKATEASTLTSASAEAVNVSGTGNVAGNTTSGLTAATAINTTGMTAGKATFTIADGTKTTYTGGAGVDSVTVSNASVAITKAIDLGAGDDTLTLEVASDDTSVAVPTATLKGGNGTDTIAMTGASAAALSANGTFAGKIEGFEKLAITDKVTAATTVNLANMDGITYVVSNNTTDVATDPVKEVFTLDVSGSTASASGGSGDTVTFDNMTYTFTANAANGTEFAAQLYSLILADQGANWKVTGVSGTKLTFEAASGGAVDSPVGGASGDFTFNEVSGSGATNSATFAVTTVTEGANASTSPALTLDKFANNGTLELVGSGDGVVVKMADATSLTDDSFNIVTKVDGVGVSGDGGLDFGTVDVAGVETLKLNAVDKSPVDADGVATISTSTLDLKADKATSLTIEGSSNVTLTLDAATTKLATINASTLTGKLDYAADGSVLQTITGGSGADTLKASVGSSAKADVINGGAGNDIITAGSNAAKLTGGAGNDLFILKAAASANVGTVGEPVWVGTDGNKESNTYSTIEDFQAGDLLQLQYFAAGTTPGTGDATKDVASFAKLTASLEGTAVLADFANAAIKQAAAGEAVWFNFQGSAYVVVDSYVSTDAFVNGEDLIIKLAGINGDNLSWNSDFATVALI